MPFFKSKIFSRFSTILRLPYFWIACVALLLVLYLAEGLLHKRLVVEPQEATVQQALSARISAAVREIDGELNQLVGNVRQAADHDWLRASFNENTEESIAMARQRLASLLPRASAINLIEKSRGFGDETNFLAKTLANEALSGNLPKPTTFKREGWFILISEPVFNTAVGEDKQVLGAILSEFPLDLISASIKQMDATSGKFELIQQISGLGRQVLISVGAGDTDIVVKMPVSAIPGWQIRLTAAQDLVLKHRANPLVLISARLALGFLFLAGVWSLARLFSHRLEAEENTVLEESSKVKPPRRKNIGPLSRGDAGFLVRSADGEPLPESSEPEVQQTEGQSEQVDENHADKLDSEATDISELDRTDETEVFELSEDENNQTENHEEALSPFATSPEGSADWPRHVFREYDIRGLAEREINEDLANALGQTLGTQVLDGGKKAIIVGRDGRLSSPALSEALIGGLLMTGCDVIDLGMVPTPAVNFANRAAQLADAAVIVTASHNPGKFNGFKLLTSNAILHGADIQSLREDMLAKRWLHGSGTRSVETIDKAYLKAICEDVQVSMPLNVVVDCGNGVAGILVPELMERLGCSCVPLYCDVDGAFPNHSPDPTEAKNLTDLIQVVEQTKADLGLAFDGDGDRLVAVSASGRIVWPDELMMIFARDIVTRHPGADIVFDVKSSRRLNDLIRDYGGRPVMWKTGHSNIREKVAELQAPLGGEFSGHLFFNDRWHGFDDGLYAAARLLEILALREQTLDALIAGFETSVATEEIRLPVEEERKFQLLEKVVASASFGDAKINTVDGLRVEFEKGWGLVRASNTGAMLTLRFEAGDAGYLEEMKIQFKELIASCAPDLEASLEAALFSQTESC